MPDSVSIESVLTENRVFEPPADFDARIGGAYFADLEAYRAMHQRSIDDPEGGSRSQKSVLLAGHRW